jgi:hypothetical protein
MKRILHFYLFTAVIIYVNISCNSKTGHYDEALWLDAFKKQEVLDVEPEKLVELEEVYKMPGLSYIDDHYMYIIASNEQTINIYSKKDFRLTVKLGGKGEGPSEFRFIQGINVYPDYIFVNSPGKNSYFSKKGELLKEVRCPPALIPCLPVGNNFVSREYSMPSERNSNSPDMERKIVLVGPDFEIKKILFHKILEGGSYVYNPKTNQKEARLFPDYCSFKIYKNNIYIGLSTQEGFFFTVLDSNGKKLYKINRPYIKRKIPDFLKEAIRKRQYRTITSNQKVKISFYKYFPSFCDFEVVDDRIYVFLYPEADRQRILIMDLKGKLLDVILIPFDSEIFETSSYRILFSNIIHKGAKYYLQDNMKTNKWEIWRLKISEYSSSIKKTKNK